MTVECPDCGDFIPMEQDVCDCGYIFGEKESA